MTVESKVVDQGACPDCSSSDAYTSYSDGHSFCFSCSTYRHDSSQEEGHGIVNTPLNNTVKPMTNNKGLHTDIPLIRLYNISILTTIRIIIT